MGGPYIKRHNGLFIVYFFQYLLILLKETQKKYMHKLRDMNMHIYSGIGGPVGSGKTALMLALCLKLREKYNLCAVTNDIFTRYPISVSN